MLNHYIVFGIAVDEPITPNTWVIICRPANNFRLSIW